MTSKLIPKDPAAVQVIRAVTPNITTISTPFARFGLIKVGGRGTIVRMTSGALAVFSPTALTPGVRTAIESLGGNVKYIAAPDLEHHIFISEWAKAFPNAHVLGPEGLPEKRAGDADRKDTKFSHVWTKENKATFTVDADFDRDFDSELLDGHANKELVFNFKPDRTLIQADLFFSLPATEQYSKSGEDATSGLFTKIFTFFNSTKTNLVWHRRFIWQAAAKDKKSFADSVRRIDGWDFDRVIPCHGDVIETGGKGIFRQVMEWHLAGKK